MVWKSASEFDGVTVCHGSGNRCYVKPPAGDFFIAPGPRSEKHDQTLTEFAAKLNELMAEVPIPESEDGRQLTFFRADQGIVLVWNVCPTDEDYEAKYADRSTGLDAEDQISRVFDLESPSA
jgi:hypothetical protein